MARHDDRHDVSGAFKLAVLVAVVVGIVIVLALTTVPKAQRPTIRQPITVQVTR
jgi:hypothetical protein